MYFDGTIESMGATKPAKIPKVVPRKSTLEESVFSHSRTKATAGKHYVDT